MLGVGTLSAALSERSGVERSIMAILGVSFFVASLRLARCGVWVDEQGIRILNPLRTTHLSWSPVKAFSLRPYRAVFKTGYVDLTDGTAIHIWGIQPPNEITRPRNRSAQRLIEELNLRLEQARLTDSENHLNTGAVPKPEAKRTLKAIAPRSTLADQPARPAPGCTTPRRPLPAPPRTP